MSNHKDIFKQTLLTSVNKYNILPFSSQCNVSCLFCSHKQNPAGIESYYLKPLSRADLQDLMVFLSPGRKIVIGESATRIMEGEPFTHPHFLETLIELRKRFSLTPLQITTNGILLETGIVKVLKELEPLEINLSLNSVSDKYRKVLMGHWNDDIKDRVRLLNESGIIFHGSLVPLPWVTGWQDIWDTIGFLERGGAQTIRVFLPGLTRFYQVPKGNGWIGVPKGDWENELKVFLKECREKCSVPLTVEPPGLTDLEAQITGVIEGSKAQSAGMGKGGRILSINGEAPFSRAEAFRTLSRMGLYDLKVEDMDGNIRECKLHMARGERSGLVMDYDLPRSIIDDMVILGNKETEPVLVLSSQWGEPLLKKGLEKVGEIKGNIIVILVKNNTFGGTIRSAGLLLVDDFGAAIKEYLQGGNPLPGLVIIPAVAFDERGRDLRGNHWSLLADAFGIRLKLL